MDRSTLSRIASKIASDPAYRRTEVAAMQTTNHGSKGDFPYNLKISLDPENPNGGCAVAGNINGVEIQGTVSTPEDDGWEHNPGPNMEDLDPDSDELQTLFDACGDAVEEAGGTTPG